MQNLFIHKFLRFLGLAAIISAMSVLSCLAQTWKSIGPHENDLPSTTLPMDTKLAKSADGSLYIAYSDSDNGYKVTVKKFNGVKWEFVGNAAVSEGYSLYLNLAIAPNGMPYVAYMTENSTGFNLLRIKKFNGSAWVDVVDEKWYRGVFFSFAIAPDGTLHIAYSQLGTGVDPVAVKRFKNNVWEDVGTAASINTGKFNKLVFGPDGTLFLAYADYYVNEKITVRKFVNNIWTTVVTEGITPARVEEFAVAIAPDGTPYLAYPDGANDNKMSVLKYNGTNAWVNVGSAGFTTGAVADVNIGILPDGTPIVMASELKGNKKVISKMFKNSNWEDAGGGTISTGTDEYPSHLVLNNTLLTGTDGVVYAAFSDSLLIHKTAVKKLVSNKWENVGSSGASPDAAGNFAFKYAPNGTPYISYNDASDQNRLHIRKFTADSWQEVGTSPAQGSGSLSFLYSDITFTPNGTPYIIYNEQVNLTYSTHVKFFNGTTWIPAGNAAITTVYATGSPKIATAADGTPYIAYIDENGSLSVKKYSAGAWVQVGAQGFFRGARNPQIIISSNGTIYAACETSRVDNNYNIERSGYVFELTGNTWQTLVNDIPYRSGLNFSITTDAAGKLYMAFSDGNNSGKFTIKSYANNAWTVIPSNTLPTDYISSGQLAVGSDNALYMNFSKYPDGILMKLKNAIWEPVGIGRAAASTITRSPQFTFSKTGDPTVAYQRGQIFVTSSTTDVPVAALKPTIDSFYPTTAGTGDTIIIKGSNFHAGPSYSWPKSVTVGTSTFASYYVNSDKQITAIVGGGSNGNISVSTINGTATLPGFNYVPEPWVIATGPTTFNSGDSVILKAMPATGFSYQWYTTNHELIPGATSSTYVAYRSGIYGLGITLNGVSRYMWFGTIVTVNFTPPAINFAVSITAAICKGAANGSVYVSGIPGTAYPGAIYTATLTGNGVNKQVTSNVAQFNNLTAGSYNICFTIAGKPDYQQCQTIVITEPKDIALYSTRINTNDKTVTLSLQGGNNYHIQVNGALHTTADSVVTLKLNQQFNDLIITTDKPCQGVIQKTIELLDKPLPYPNPFNEKLNIAIGNQVTKTANAEVYNSMGKLIYKKTFINPYQEVQLDLSGIEQTGTYTLKLVTDTEERTFKIIKQ